MTKGSIFKSRIFRIAILVLIYGSQNTECGSVGQLSGSGRASGGLSLSSGGLAGLAVSSGMTGARAASVTSGGADATDMIDFGDLTQGSGERLQGSVGLTLRGNASYSLNISQSNYTAVALRFGNRDVSLGDDRGSFIQVRLGTITGTGARANAARTVPNGAMQSGMTLDNISQGPVRADSTRLCSGDAPSLGGTANSADNALNIPIIFSVPTGAEFGPVGGAAQGRFQVTVQIGAFPLR